VSSASVDDTRSCILNGLVLAGLFQHWLASRNFLDLIDLGLSLNYLVSAIEFSFYLQVQVELQESLIPNTPPRLLIRLLNSLRVVSVMQFFP
jgi:hypothetical protein